nr:hypothetical protein [uncultured Blautia sp.]
MAYAEDFSDDISVNSVESNETEEQETELPDVEEEPTEEDDSIVDEAEIQEGEETDDALSEVDIFSVGDEEVYIEDLSIISEPNKKEYDYGTVHSAKDFDLTGLAVKVSYSDQTKKILYFTKDGEVKTDSKGNKFYSEIDFWGEGELGSYSVTIMDEDEEYVVSTELNIVIPANMPQLKNQGKGVFSATLAANTYAKFIPNQNGKYIVKRTYTDESDGYSFVESIYDSEFNQVYDSGDSVESVQLKKGSVYYLFPSDRKSKVTAEFVWSVKSVELEGKFKSAVFYTPVNFSTDSTTKKYSIEKTPWHTQKLKITYADGSTESVGLYKSDRYKQVVNAYINYSGKKDAPEAGTYDVHFELGGKEAVLKNGIQIKTLSQMPAITGKGTKEMAVTGGTVYGCLKTTSATSYTIKCEPQTMPYLTVYQLKNGKLEQVLSVENGKSCTLKPNSVYYIGMRLHSAVLDLDKVKFTVSSVEPKVQMSKTKISIGTLSYTGSNVKPSVTVKNGNKTLKQNTDYTISYSKASKVGAAVKITITGKGSYTGKVTKNAYIVPARTAISSVKAGKKNLTVTYKKTTGASGYQIAYSTSQNSGYKYVNLNNKTVKKTISKLTSGKKYYVKVRAYRTINGKNYYGNYSAVKAVKVN